MSAAKYFASWKIFRWSVDPSALPGGETNGIQSAKIKGVEPNPTLYMTFNEVWLDA